MNKETDGNTVGKCQGLDNVTAQGTDIQKTVVHTDASFRKVLLGQNEKR